MKLFRRLSYAVIAAFLILVNFLPEKTCAAEITKFYFSNETSDGADLVFEVSHYAGIKYKIDSGTSIVNIDFNNGKWLAKSSRNTRTDLVKDISYERSFIGKLKVTLLLDDHTSSLKPKLTAGSGGSNKVVFSLKRKKTAALPKKNEDDIPLSMRHDYKSKTWSLPSFEPFKWKGYGNKNKEPGEPASEENDSTPPERPENGIEASDYKPVIVIDPGHGGHDSGAISRSKIKEKKITYEYAQELERRLNASGKYKVFLTRNGDRYITLSGRVKKAQGFGADLFISLHADSHPNPKTRGLSVYTLSEKRAKREATKLYNKAQKETVIQGLDLRNERKVVRDVLIDMVQRDTKNSSSIFAQMLVDELGESEVKLLDRTHRFAGFAVLTGADIPSALIELGYLTNANEEKLLRTDAYRTKLTSKIKNAIDNYFSKYYPVNEK